MNAIAVLENTIPGMTDEEVQHVSGLEALMKDIPQVSIPVEHVLHGGMYARTVVIPAGVMITGALVKVPTLLFVSGDVSVFVGKENVRLQGERMLSCSANRKQAFYAHEDTRLTMVLPTHAETVAEAEEAFTDEAGLLSSRDGDTKNTEIITGE